MVRNLRGKVLLTPPSSSLFLMVCFLGFWWFELPLLDIVSLDMANALLNNTSVIIHHHVRCKCVHELYFLTTLV